VVQRYIYSIDADPRKIGGRSSIASTFGSKIDSEKLAGKVGSVQINNHNIFHKNSVNCLHTKIQILKVGTVTDYRDQKMLIKYVCRLKVFLRSRRSVCLKRCALSLLQKLPITRLCALVRQTVDLDTSCSTNCRS
jgi:hypothetical protein